MKKIYLMLFPLSMLMGGCGIYTKYKPVALEYDPQTLVTDTDTVPSPLAVIPWQQLFSDPYLKTWIEAGLKANTDLRAAQLGVDQAAATLTASRLAFLPSVSLGADASTGTNTNRRFQIAPSAAWELDIFGKQRNLKLGAEASFYASQAYCQAVRTSLIASIAEGYYNLLMLDRQLEISTQTLQTWEENIRVLKALKRAGRSNEAAVLQADANRIKVEASVEALAKQIALQENAIRSLLLNPSMDMSRGTLAGQSFPEILSEGVNVAMLSNRPDVRQAEFNLQKAFYDVNVSRAAFYPSITISGSAGWITQSGSVADPSTWFANALGSLAAPLFNRGTNQANLRISKAQYDISSLRFQQSLLDAGMEVRNAMTSWETARKRIDLDARQIKTLEDAVRATQLLMRNSPTNYLEVLTAQQRLLEAQLSETSDRYSEIESVITFFHALGGWTQD